MTTCCVFRIFFGNRLAKRSTASDIQSIPPQRWILSVHVVPLFWVGAKKLLSLSRDSYLEVTNLVLLSGNVPEDFSVWVSSDLGSDLTSCDRCGVQASDYKVNIKYCSRVELKLSRASQTLLLPCLLPVLVGPKP